MHSWRNVRKGMAPGQMWGSTGSWMPSTICFANASAKQGVELEKQTNKQTIFVPLYFYNKQDKKCFQRWRDSSMWPIQDHTGAKSEEEEGRKPANKLTGIPALTAHPTSSDAQCLLCRQHSASCPLGKFSAELIQVNAARMALDLGTTEPKSRMWLMLTILGAWATLFSNLGKFSSPCLSFCLLSAPMNPWCCS